jgi:hypothetical protein
MEEDGGRAQEREAERLPLAFDPRPELLRRQTLEGNPPGPQLTGGRRFRMKSPCLWLVTRMLPLSKKG